MTGLVGAELDRLANSNTLVSLGGGAFFNKPLSKSLSMSVFVGGRYYIDGTDPTTCNDGTTSTSTGSGTCSHHGGIAHLNDPIGSGFSMEYSVGLTYSLDTDRSKE